jgi:membrane associated rhomboid family serine protease
VFVQVDQRPRRLTPWATIAIIAICVAAFLVLALESADERAQFLRHWGTVPATLSSDAVPLVLRAVPLLTSLFLHADWLHLTGNLLFLMIFGISAERALGSRRFIALFLLGGAAANLAGALTLANASTPIVGSSGAVSAIVGAYFALFPRARLGLVLPLGLFLEFVRIPAPVLIGFWILLQLLFTFAGPTFGAVVWWTHIAGFALGILFALVSRPAVGRRLRT